MICNWLVMSCNELTIGCINYIFHKVKNQITWKCFTMIPTNCLCWKIPLCAYWAKKGNMIISKEIIFNQPWFHCYFLLNKHTASCNFITQRCSHFCLLLLPLCSLNPKFTSHYPSVPVLDDPIPATRGHFWGFVGVPQHAYTHVVVRLEFVVQFCCFPVPHIHFAISISRN